MRDPNWGLPQERHRGFCRVCCKLEELTFEHLPPRNAGNRHTIRSVPYDVWHQHDDIHEFPKRGWTQQQKGSGGYVLCQRCNSTTGHLWVPEYARWSNSLLSELHRHGPLPEPPPGAHHALQVRMGGVHPGRFARQVLTMLLAVSGGPTTSANNPQVQSIVLDGACGLPGSLRVFMNLYVGPHIRLLPVMGAMNLATRRHEVSVEVAFPPFAFVGVVAGSPRDEEGGLEITDWTQMAPERRCDVELSLPLSYGYTPFIGDYRPAHQILADAA